MCLLGHLVFAVDASVKSRYRFTKRIARNFSAMNTEYETENVEKNVRSEQERRQEMVV